ncbi:MAG: hypothetical protein F9K43_28540, partial [Bauldia sp.]
MVKIFVHGAATLNGTLAASDADGAAPAYYEVVSIAGDTIILKTGQLLQLESGKSIAIGLVTVERVTPPPVMKAIVINRREDVDVDVRGMLSADAGGDIYLGSEETIRLNTVVAGTEHAGVGTIRIKTGGSIVNAASSGVNLTGADIILEASQGHIGEASKAVTVSHATGGLTARAKESIWITAPATDLRVDSIYSAEGDVFLTANAGSIVDALGGDGAKIVARHVALSAVNGSIGSAGDYLDIDITGDLHAPDSADPDAGLDQAGVGTVTAVAKGGVYLSETEGDMNVRGITATQGDVFLRSDLGSIVDAEYSTVVDEDGNVV